MPLPVTRSGNPSLNERVFASQPRPAYGAERMTLQGSINKAFLLLVVLLAGAFWPWSQYMTNGDLSVVSTSLLVGSIGGLVLALIISFKANLAPVLAVPYAALEGLAIGGISAVLEQRYPGIAIQAVGLTFAVLAVMLVAYKTGLIRATERFRAVVIGATGAIALMYLVSIVLSLFHVNVPILSSSSPLSIIISLVIVGVAALNLILDFDFIESGAAQGAPRYMEWYAAFGLLVTMVWLYLEILRLLSKLNGGDRR
ncbi:MAG TPA: Bax inhibitor-1/YccA family protein [Steroidobacteraceae bacterium]|nr:Bax inhibitor-1/YccA family protein [Steroidobacteraceae bacterium]